MMDSYTLFWTGVIMALIILGLVFLLGILTGLELSRFRR